MTILVDEYFEDSICNFAFAPATEDYTRASDLLDKVNGLLADLGLDRGLRSGHRSRAKTLHLIAVGYRAAVGGTHEQSNGVDVDDTDNVLDALISTFDEDGGAGNALLERFGLYREDPADTPTWCHLQRVPPVSMRRTYRP